MAARQRILFVDAYDSFSNNITSLLSTLLDVDVFVLSIDTPLLDPQSASFQLDWSKELSHYAAVVCGPGPGSPAVQKDVGLMRNLWSLEGSDVVPVLGICLGYQSLVAAFGASIRQLRRALHGMVRPVLHRQSDEQPETAAHDVFSGVRSFKATLYHSLCADIGQDHISPSQWTTQRWKPASQCPDLMPLAWVEEQGEHGAERILMAARHAAKPFWGLQYHPESVCTESEGHRVLQNWFREALQWNRDHNRRVNTDKNILAANATRRSLLSYAPDMEQMRRRPSAGPDRWQAFALGHTFHYSTIELPPGAQVPDLVEVLAAKGTEHIVLDSANAYVRLPKKAADVRGRYSIIALDVDEALRLEYQTGDGFATARLPCFPQKVSLEGYQSIWQLVAEFHRERRIESRYPLASPFFGGFMGYVTYEQGLEDIHVDFPRARDHYRPDLCLAWITKSLVVDHVRGLVHVQHLRPQQEKERGWVEATVSQLQNSHPWRHSAHENHESPNVQCLSGSQKLSWQLEKPGKVAILAPQPADYEEKVRLCQQYIAAGESYELCLTEQTTISLAVNDHGSDQTRRKRGLSMCAASSSWQLYRALRSRQPAPFASYIRLGGATLVSSSPERFLQYDREGLCSMKPMKGTVRKSDEVQSLAQAKAILHVPKEEAENLMIVDLVRHDLHGICGPGNVSVPHLMTVEEYQSVFQMTTAVEGRLPRPNNGGEHRRYTGLDVLAASLPPGSMTGAPKKRSCEILQQIEGHEERSLYSGVVGYMCVSGRGDWSVTIRSMFRWDDEQTSSGGVDDSDDETEVWRIGAGGAVTILSTPEGETDEMFTKLNGPLSIFAGSGQ